MQQLIKTGPIFTDLYELTMAQCYFADHITHEATFSLFVRGYPPRRNHYVAAGLWDALAEILDYRFSDSDLLFLRDSGFFTDDFINLLKDFHFTGTIRAMPEGTIFFSDEPVMEVTAPIMEAQILETFLVNTIGLSSLIATKASRCVHAAGGRPLVDFSLRRDQGMDAGVKVARSSYIAGFTATSNVLAGKLYGIPLSGTMAHSFVSSHQHEIDAFFAYAKNYPESTVLLIDTYDTVEGAKNAAKVGIEMRKRGHSLRGVRLDSGDMADLSKKVRKILDEAGLYDVRVIASSGFDEFKIRRVLDAGAKIDAFGVGTKMGVSADAPYLDMVYKLVHCGGRDIKKLSSGKINLAGRKQVFRRTTSGGMFESDIIGTRDEEMPETTPLLEIIIENGRLVMTPPELEEIRKYCTGSRSRLDPAYRTLEAEKTYPVLISPRLQAIQKKLESE